jgi:hypothetical protein
VHASFSEAAVINKETNMQKLKLIINMYFIMHEAILKMSSSAYRKSI